MRKLLQIFLILTIFLALIPYNASAITLGEYEATLQKYIDQANANQAAINKTEAQIKETNNEIANIKTEMTNLTAEIEKLNQEIVEYNEKIKEKSLQTKEIFQYFQMAKGENVNLEYIFGAESVTDMIYRMAIVEQMTEYNNKVTKELEGMIEQNKKREIEIDNRKKELSTKQKEMEQKLVSLGNSKQSLTAGGATIQDEVKNYRAIVKAYKDMGCQSNHVIGVDCATSGSAGVFRRPISTGYITSEFGSRWGSFHRGLDMSNDDPYNTRIYPVANGTVSAKYYDLYGALCVAIIHYEAASNTYYTSLYVHLSSWAPDLYVGKYVTTDTYIGYMGSTGYSTGPHLHMELAPCRLYVDGQCATWNSYVSFVKNQNKYNGFKGPRQLINFPSGLYNSWHTR